MADPLQDWYNYQRHLASLSGPMTENLLGVIRQRQARQNQLADINSQREFLRELEDKKFERQQSIERNRLDIEDRRQQGYLKRYGEQADAIEARRQAHDKAMAENNAVAQIQRAAGGLPRIEGESLPAYQERAAAYIRAKNTDTLNYYNDQAEEAHKTFADFYDNLRERIQGEHEAAAVAQGLAELKPTPQMLVQFGKNPKREKILNVLRESRRQDLISAFQNGYNSVAALEPPELANIDKRRDVMFLKDQALRAAAQTAQVAQRFGSDIDPTKIRKSPQVQKFIEQEQERHEQKPWPTMIDQGPPAPETPAGGGFSMSRTLNTLDRKSVV